MSTDRTNNQPPGGAVSPFIPAAKEWAEKRKPADLCLELFVRLAELTVACARLAEMHGQDLDGNPILTDAQHPAPSPAALRSWLAQLLPETEG